jgi:hypothetical protein
MTLDDARQVAVFIARCLGVCLFVLGTLVTGLNIYLWFIRYPLHRFRGGKDENLRHVSVVGIVSSLFFWACAWLWRDVPAVMWTSIGMSVIDPGGYPWCIAILSYLYFTAKWSTNNQSDG